MKALAWIVVAYNAGIAAWAIYRVARPRTGALHDAWIDLHKSFLGALSVLVDLLAVIVAVSVLT